MTNNESLEIKRFFELQNIKLSDIWLESCLNWCKDEILTNNYTQKELQTQVYEQWLLLDLRDVELAILPLNLSTRKHYILNGIYCLQIMEICDISKPKLWQLQNIRNRNSLTKKYNDQDNESNNNKRMLELVLTDGVQQIQAIEYRPIPFININLTPGIKIQLIGPITVRRGRLLLEPHNIKILNGQVEELIITNAAENVLARHLNLPLNPNPQNVEQIENTVEQPQNNRNQQIPPPRVVNNQNNNQRIDDNDERMIAEEIDILLEAEQSLINGNRNEHQSNPVPSLDDDFFDDIDIDAHLNQVDDVLNRQQQPIEPKTNFLTIEKLLQNKNQINKGVFRIKAKFKSIVEKVTMDENEYRLIIKIQDEQMDEIDCKVHSDIITNFAGHYPAALTSLKSNVLQKDPIATEKVLKALQNIKNKIITIDNILEIQIDRNDELCTIVKIL